MSNAHSRDRHQCMVAAAAIKTSINEFHGGHLEFLIRGKPLD